MHCVRYILLFILLLCISACTLQNQKQTDKPLVVTTTGMIADIVKNVGGDFVSVEPLMAPGMDPHSYKASERDIIKLASADIIFHNGLHLEGKLGDVLARARNTIPSYAVSLYISTDGLIMVSENEADPHIWFDPMLWARAVNLVADTLVEIDPANSIYYRKNEDNYIQQLLSLDQELRNKLSRVPPKSRVLVTSHDAFSYFGRAYDWEVIGIQGINTASETSVYNIQNLARMLAQREIPCIFTETSAPTRSVEAITASAAALGVELKHGEPLYSDSLGPAGTKAETYIGMMHYNVDTILTGILNI